MKRIIALLLTLTMLFALCACNSAAAPAGNENPTGSTEPEGSEPVDAEPADNEEPTEQPETPADIPDYDVRSHAKDWEYHEVCYVGNSGSQYVEIPYYSLENVIYCTNPVDENYQVMNIYVPACYMTETEDGVCIDDVRGLYGLTAASGKTLLYAAREVPIIYLNTINGYAAGTAPTISDGLQGQNAGNLYQFLEQGFVLVCVGARGRTSTNPDGAVNGYAPAGLVDLKAGVRWLKYNDEFLPGDSNKIVTVGVSSGGSLSALLGSTGDSELYAPYLEEIGALDASDSVWSTVAYCPVSNLEFADGIAQWQYGPKSGEDFTSALSRTLYGEFVEYMQSLGFDLGDDGVSGSFYDGQLAAFEAAFDNHIAADKLDGEEFIRSIDPKGTWLTWSEETGVKITSIHDFVGNYWASGPMPINGIIPSFDGFDSTSFEGQVFGGRHFSWMVLDALKELSGQYAEADEYIAAYKADLEDGMRELARLYDPIPFIVEGNSTLAQHWRFQIGSEDTNITQAIAWTIYSALESYADVDAQYAILYGIGHQTVEYSPYDLIGWIYLNDQGAVPSFSNAKKMQFIQEDGGTIEPGTYTMTETNAMGLTLTWTLILNEDGTYSLSESGIVDKTYTGIYGVLEGFASLGPINEADGPRGDGFGDGYISVWTTYPDGSCSRVNLNNYTEPGTNGSTIGASSEKSEGSDQNDGEAVTGTYTYKEINAIGMEITWTLVLNEDMTYSLSETGIVEKTYTGIYGVSGGHISLGPINEADGPRGENFGEDRGYISVWTVSADGTCARVDLSGYKAP